MFPSDDFTISYSTNFMSHFPIPVAVCTLYCINTYMH